MKSQNRSIYSLIMSGPPHQTLLFLYHSARRLLVIGLCSAAGLIQAQTSFELNLPTLDPVTDAAALKPAPILFAFTDRAVPLTWHLHGLPGTEVQLTGSVFAVGGPMAAPVPGLAFELSGKLEPSSIKTVLNHRFPAPGGERPQTFLVRWQATLSDIEQPLSGALRIQFLTRGKLTPLKRVWLPALEELQPLRQALEADGVDVSPITEEESIEAGWQGVRIEWPADAMLDQPLLPKLEAGQVVIRPAKGQMAAQKGLISGSHGAGRIVRLPASILVHLPDDPALQSLLVEACLSQNFDN
jgi:hypothetical protein